MFPTPFLKSVKLEPYEEKALLQTKLQKHPSVVKKFSYCLSETLSACTCGSIDLCLFKLLLLKWEY